MLILKTIIKLIFKELALKNIKLALRELINSGFKLLILSSFDL
jgi:hypothetical protein